MIEIPTSSGGSSGSSSAPSPAPAPMALGRVTFDLDNASRVDIVRVHIGTRSRDYDQTFVLMNVSLSGTRAMATDPRIKAVLDRPNLYFVALTSVGTNGQESDFSNELRIDTRTQRAALDAEPTSPLRSTAGWLASMISEASISGVWDSNLPSES